MAVPGLPALASPRSLPGLSRPGRASLFLAHKQGRAPLARSARPLVVIIPGSEKRRPTAGSRACGGVPEEGPRDRWCVPRGVVVTLQEGDLSQRTCLEVRFVSGAS